MVYVDHLFQQIAKESQAFRVGKRNNHLWCHMWADTVEELVAFATDIGLKEQWLQNNERFPHFDLTPGRRKKAIARGATEVNLRTWFRSHLKRL
jgi:Protein of unknown function (DUF4031)